MKLKISFLFIRNENELILSSKYQIAKAIIIETKMRITGKTRQQNLFFSIEKDIDKTKDITINYSI